MNSSAICTYFVYTQPPLYAIQSITYTDLNSIVTRLSDTDLGYNVDGEGEPQNKNRFYGQDLTALKAYQILGDSTVNRLFKDFAYSLSRGIPQGVNDFLPHFTPADYEDCLSHLNARHIVSLLDHPSSYNSLIMHRAHMFNLD